MRVNQRGFTLIELLVVIVVIGILVMVTLANYISMQDRARIGQVRESMHVVQLTAESFSTRNNGGYPASAAAVTADGALTFSAMLPGATMPINPFTQVPTNLDWTTVLLSVPVTDGAGGISFNITQSVAGGAWDRYDIVGEDNVGTPLAQVFKNY